jgi:hypothetical protein
MVAESKLAEIEKLLNEMKETGVGGGLIRKDGIVIKTTMAVDEVASTVIARSANISDALLQKDGDKQKEVEIGLDGKTLVIVPMGNYFFFGMAKSKEEKITALDYSRKMEKLL